MKWKKKKKRKKKLTGSAVKQCSSNWSATAGKVAQSNFGSINLKVDRSLLESIDRFSAEN
jgi:hypothetical protein